MIGKRTGIYRSLFEARVAKVLHTLGVRFEYEKTKLTYVVPERTATYTPDFVLPNGVIIECKGRFTTEDRKKMLLVIANNPTRDIRMLFQNSRVKIRKGSKTSYADWCNKNSVQWAEGQVPQAWIKEKKK